MMRLPLVVLLFSILTVGTVQGQQIGDQQSYIVQSEGEECLSNESAFRSAIRQWSVDVNELAESISPPELIINIDPLGYGPYTFTVRDKFDDKGNRIKTFQCQINGSLTTEINPFPKGPGGF